MKSSICYGIITKKDLLNDLKYMGEMSSKADKNQEMMSTC